MNQIDINRDIWNKIMCHLEIIGFKNITQNFFEQVHNRNIDFVKQYCEQTFSTISYKGTNDDEKKYCRVVYTNNEHKTERLCFDYIQNITTGSNSSISIWKAASSQSYNDDIKYNSQYVLKRCLYSDDDAFFNFFIDLFIHAVMYSHFKIILNSCTENKFIVPLYMIVFHKSRNKLVGIMEQIETDMHFLLREPSISNISKVDIYYDIIYKIASWLKVAQHDLNFVHFDLKNNNIFMDRKDKKYGYDRDNLNIYVGDFGSSRIQYGDYILSGENFYELDHTQFSPTRDLYQLIHTAAMFSCPDEAQRHMLKLSRIMGTSDKRHLDPDDEKWHDIYKNLNYDSIYSPSNTINKFHILFPQLYKSSSNILNFHHSRIDNINKTKSKKYILETDNEN